MKTNKQKIIIVSLIIVLLVAGGIWIFSLLNEDTTQEDTGRDRNLFPFGEILPGSGRGDTENQDSVDSETDNQQQETIDENDELQRASLQLINEEPTGGFTFIVREEEEGITQEQQDNEGNIVREIETILVENTYLRYHNIDNGSVFETKVNSNEAFNEELIVENFIPNVEESVYSSSGDHILFQYWDKEERAVESYLGSISPISLDIEECPFDFSGPITIGEENASIFDIHRFFNREAATRVAQTGGNSPGNESTLSSEATIDALRRFQEQQGITADGALGPQTRSVMLDVCNEQQEEIARQERAAQETQFQISGFFLPQNIVSAQMHPEENRLFYLHEGSTGVTGTIRNIDSGERREVFTSPFTEWTSYWNSNDFIEITTKPSYASLGYSYDLEVETGNFHKSFQERKGLQVKPNHQNSMLLIHDVETERSQLSIFNRSNGRFRPLNIETFVDKCTWSSDDRYIYCAVPNALAYGQEYPDTWYQGREGYSDSLYRINAMTLEEELITDIRTDYGESLDVESIMIDDNSRYLGFIDKTTEQLWLYILESI